MKHFKTLFPDAEPYKLRHAIRLNGVVDVWNNGVTVYCLPENEYKNFQDLDERNAYIKYCLDKHEKRHPMKRLPKTGNMSWQEYVNNQHQ